MLASSGACCWADARGGPQRGGSRRRGLAGVQLRFGVPPPGIPGAVRAAQVLPGFRGRIPGGRVAGPGEAGPFGVPGGPLGRDGGHVGVVGERGTAHPLYPQDQAVRGGQGRARAGWSRRARAVSARSAQARIPAASSRPHKIVRSGAGNRAMTRCTSARASAGRPAHSASSAAHCAVSRAISMLPDEPVMAVSCCQRSAAAPCRRAAGRFRRGWRAPASGHGQAAR